LITNVTGQIIKGYTPPSVIPTVIRSRNLEVENAELPGGVVTAVIINGSEFGASVSNAELAVTPVGDNDLTNSKPSSAGTFSSYVSVSSPSRSNPSVRKSATDGDDDFVAAL
jgi:hypothetical protein